MPVASLSRVRELLDSENRSAKKKFGQNFLIDHNVVEKIAELAAEKAYATLEIGPGIGSLTEPLLAHSREVFAYEIDPDMVNILRGEFIDQPLTLFESDFLKVDLEAVPFKNEEINVCSNLPYYVTTPILFRLFESELKIRKITVMVQKEVAERFKAERGSEDYNALSVIVQYLYDVKYEMNVSRHVFYPQPNVDSAIISFSPKRTRDYQFESGFFAFVKSCFAQRRKTLKNNLKAIMGSEEIEQLFLKSGLKESIRAQELGLEDYLNLYEVKNAG